MNTSAALFSSESCDLLFRVQKLMREGGIIRISKKQIHEKLWNHMTFLTS